MPAQKRPWITGPRELLDHGLEHLQGNATDFDRRIALISIDNAVELMIKTYLSQPSRALGLRIPRKRLEEISGSFPDLLDALEQYGKDRLGEIDLSDIEWFHRLRNELYHAGNGLTVEKQKVTVYAQIAEQLFVNLFEIPPSKQSKPDTVGDFIRTISELQNLGEELAKRDGITNAMGYQPSYLALTRRFSNYDRIRQFRNNLVHSIVRQSEADLQKFLSELKTMLKKAQDELASTAT
jgi:hypothetical protein